MVYRRLVHIILLFYSYTSFSVDQDAIIAVQNIPNWTTKIDYAAKKNILNNNFLESWRVLQLAKTTETPLKDQDYFLALTGTKLNVCPFAYKTDIRWRDHLLYAYSYRFRHRFAGNNQAKSPYDLVNSKYLVSQLNNEQNFYLKDIPKAKPIKKSGCDFKKSSYKDRKLASEKEFLHLLTWYHQTRSLSMPNGSNNVIFRLLHLALKHGDEEDQKMLEQHFLKYKKQDWLDLEEPERSLLWQKFSKIDDNKSIPLTSKHEFEQTIETIILNSKHPNSTNWLGAIAFNELPMDRQRKLVDHLLTIKNIKDKHWLLNQKHHQYSLWFH